MTTYTWEIQRMRHGLWSHQAVLGEPADPRGHEGSDLGPDDFAQQIAERHQPAGQYRIAVWDTAGVGKLPVAIL